jgi:hypothetical protein
MGKASDKEAVMGETRHHGGCACGAVRFVAEGEPCRVGLCHCLTCRKQHAAPFSAFAVFPAERVRVTGETGLFQASPHGHRHFCRRCGAPVFSSEEGSGEIELFLGSFDETSRWAPRYEAWVPRREARLPPLPSVHRYFDRNRAGPLGDASNIEARPTRSV